MELTWMVRVDGAFQVAASTTCRMSASNLAKHVGILLIRPSENETELSSSTEIGSVHSPGVTSDTFA